jgi:hypothetical protein
MLACAAVAAATIAELVFLPALLVVTDAFVQRRQVVRRDGIFGSKPSGEHSPRASARGFYGKGSAAMNGQPTPQYKP